MHPNYTAWRPGTTDWDIAVMKLTKMVDITDFVRPVCVPTADMNEMSSFPPEKDAIVTGWGTREQGGDQSPDLYEVTVPIVSQDDCQEYYADKDISDRMICAGFEEGMKDSCQGDSGGPMVALPDTTDPILKDRWFQPGIVSWGEGCAQPEYPGVYTRVSAFEDWLAPIFDSNTGPTEKYGETGCAMDEFMCKGHLCLSHASRCDGVNDCHYKHDEYQCGTYAKFFDPMPAKKLVTFRVSFDVNDDEECAQHCIDRDDFNCFAFDTEIVNEKLVCRLADENVTTSDVKPPSDDMMHYQLVKPSTYGDKEMSFDQMHNFLITPRWMLQQGSNDSSWFIWNIEPAKPAGRYNSVEFNFIGVRSLAEKSEECTTAEDMNMVVIRSGVEVSSPVAAAFCLNELPDTFRVVSTKVRVEFFTKDPNVYGFLAEYNAGWFCEDTVTTSPGTVTSPNYPSNYGPNSQCTTLLQAPEGIKIHLNLTTILLENSPEGECYDSLTLYDGSDSNSPMLEQFCANESAYYEMTSSSNSIFLELKSDASVQKQGFKASYKFLTGPTNEEILETTLTNFKYGMTAMAIFFFCLTMVFIASIITINSRENMERSQIEELKRKHSVAGVEVPKVVDDTVDWDKPSTSQAGSGSGGSDFAEVNEVDGKTNPAYQTVE